MHLSLLENVGDMLNPWFPDFSLYFELTCFFLHVFILVFLLLCCAVVFSSGNTKQFTNLTVVYLNLVAM